MLQYCEAAKVAGFLLAEFLLAEFLPTGAVIVSEAMVTGGIAAAGKRTCPRGRAFQEHEAPPSLHNFVIASVRGGWAHEYGSADAGPRCKQLSFRLISCRAWVGRRLQGFALRRIGNGADVGSELPGRSRRQRL
jgi:hypothetical protein